MTTNWPELDKDHLIKICIDQNIELDALREKLAAMESQEDYRPAVPDGWKLVPVEPTPEMESTFNDWMGVEGNFRQGYDGLLYAAPSHSQQSTRITQQDDQEIAHCAIHEYIANPSITMDELMVTPWMLKKINPDRCPSHESEQGYDPKSFGAVPDQQTEGE